MDLKNYRVTIRSDRFYLRVLEESDASEKYASWLNDPIVNKYLETKETTIEKLKKYINEKLESGTCLLFGIFLNENDQHIGNVKLELADFEEKHENLGIFIGERDYWGKGIATEVIGLITDYALNNLGVDKLCLGVLSGNDAAIRVYEKCGYKKFKVYKNLVNYSGVLYDQMIMCKWKSAAK